MNDLKPSVQLVLIYKWRLPDDNPQKFAAGNFRVSRPDPLINPRHVASRIRFSVE